MYQIMYVYNNVHAATFVLEVLSLTHIGVNVIHTCLVLRTCLEYYHQQYFIVFIFYDTQLLTRERGVTGLARR